MSLRSRVIAPRSSADRQLIRHQPRHSRILHHSRSWRCSGFGVDELRVCPRRTHHLVIGRSTPLHAVRIICSVEFAASNPIMAENDADEQVPVDDLTPEEANRIIHSHRKVRYGKHLSMAINSAAQGRANSAPSYPSGSHRIAARLMHCRHRLLALPSAQGQV